MDDDIHDEIERLETRIAALEVSRERSRKISLAAKLTIAAGAVWIVLVFAQVVLFAPASFTAAMAAVIGGIVLGGSNSSTWRQTELAIDKARTERAGLIDDLSLTLVPAERPTLH